MSTTIRTLSLLFCLAFTVAASVAEQKLSAVPVQVEQREGKWQLLRGGRLFLIQGAGGSGSLARLKSAGANSIRTWGVDNVGPLLDEAQRLNMTVAVGIWLGHERHGFRYSDPAQVAAQAE